MEIRLISAQLADTRLTLGCPELVNKQKITNIAKQIIIKINLAVTS